MRGIAEGSSVARNFVEIKKWKDRSRERIKKGYCFFFDGFFAAGFLFAGCEVDFFTDFAADFFLVAGFAGFEAFGFWEEFETTFFTGFAVAFLAFFFSGFAGLKTKLVISAPGVRHLIFQLPNDGYSLVSWNNTLALSKVVSSISLYNSLKSLFIGSNFELRRSSLKLSSTKPE